MGIFKNLINRVLDVEVPPLVEQFVKGLKNSDKDKGADINISPQIGQVVYSEREIPDDSEEARKISKKQEEENQLIIHTMGEFFFTSGFFKQDKIPEILKRIRDTGEYSNDIFSYDDCLSLEEKKSLGLATRKKYPREMINFMTDLGIKHDDPQGIISNIYYQADHKIQRKIELERLKAAGFKTVKIEDCGDERDCKAIKRLKKGWPIDEVPELPLPNCKADYCRCTYVAHNIFE